MVQQATENLHSRNIRRGWAWRYVALNLLLGGWKRRETSHEFETSMDYVMISEVRLSYRVSPYIKTTTTC